MGKKRFHIRASRKFGGKKFDYLAHTEFKPDAQRIAEHRRRQGNLARVIPHWYHGYVIYMRKKG